MVLILYEILLCPYGCCLLPVVNMLNYITYTPRFFTISPVVLLWISKNKWSSLCPSLLACVLDWARTQIYPFCLDHRVLTLAISCSLSGSSLELAQEDCTILHLYNSSAQKSLVSSANVLPEVLGIHLTFLTIFFHCNVNNTLFYMGWIGKKIESQLENRM